MGEKYIALITNKLNNYDRYFVCAYAVHETFEHFMQRIKKCYDYTKYQIEFYKVSESWE